MELRFQARFTGRPKKEEYVYTGRDELNLKILSLWCPNSLCQAGRSCG